MSTLHTERIAIILMFSYVFLLAGGCGSRTGAPDSGQSGAKVSLQQKITETHFQEIAHTSTSSLAAEPLSQNNSLILSACQAFCTGRGKFSLKNHMFGEEGYCGWQYLLINGKRIEHILDPREDRSAGNPEVRSSNVVEIRVVFRDAEHDNHLQPFVGSGPKNLVLFLQFRLDGSDSFATFQ